MTTRTSHLEPRSVPPVAELDETRREPAGARARLRAIGECFLFGLLPSPFYEDNPHYEFGYWTHLRVNLRYAWHLMTGGEIEPANDASRATSAGTRPSRPGGTRGR